MAQWVNCLRNNIFINPPPLPLLCEISSALHLAQLDLTAGRQAGGRLVLRGLAVRISARKENNVWSRYTIQVVLDTSEPTGSVDYLCCL